jgi:hypothetical protein
MTPDNGIDQRNGLWRYGPIISLFNSLLMIIIGAGGIAWAITQEKTDSTLIAEVGAIKDVNKRQDHDISQNRTEFIQAIKDLRDEIAKLNTDNQRQREREAERRR